MKDTVKTYFVAALLSAAHAVESHNEKVLDSYGPAIYDTLAPYPFSYSGYANNPNYGYGHESLYHKPSLHDSNHNTLQKHSYRYGDVIHDYSSGSDTEFDDGFTYGTGFLGFNNNEYTSDSGSSLSEYDQYYGYRDYSSSDSLFSESNSDEDVNHIYTGYNRIIKNEHSDDSSDYYDSASSYYTDDDYASTASSLSDYSLDERTDDADSNTSSGGSSRGYGTDASDSDSVSTEHGHYINGVYSYHRHEGYDRGHHGVVTGLERLAKEKKHSHSHNSHSYGHRY